MSKIKYVLFVAVLAMFIMVPSKKVNAQVYVLTDGTVFDSDFYANLYPDVKGVRNAGVPDFEILYHYIIYGTKEGRFPNAYAYTAAVASLNPGQAVSGADLVPVTSYTGQSGQAIIPIASAGVPGTLNAPITSWNLANVNGTYWYYNGYGMYVGPLPIAQ